MSANDNDDAGKNPMCEWQQGDYVLDAGGFMMAEPIEPDPEWPYVAEFHREEDGVVGLVAISQTCDLVQGGEGNGRDYVSFSPLVRVSEGVARDALRGRKPGLAELETGPDGCFVDLTRTMTASKDLVRTWTRQNGFDDQEKRIKFGRAIARKYGNFAFPDAFDVATKNFRERAWSKHGKPNAPLYKVYRSIAEIRFMCAPVWEAEEKVVQLLAILEPEDQRLETFDEIKIEIEGQCAVVEWPEGYIWADPAFRLGGIDDFTARDIKASQAADFDYLCW